MKKNRSISLITIVALLLFAPLNAAAATRFSDGVYTFEKTEGAVKKQAPKTRRHITESSDGYVPFVV